MWKRSKEHTSCGRSGVHFRHFQASCHNPKLCDLDRWFVETTMITGYSLNRWKQGKDVMIPKKSDSLLVDKLRTIVLMEADFNFVNKVIGKQVITNAKTAKSIAQEQFGSKKNKSC
jgi:hypothetical protein